MTTEKLLKYLRTVLQLETERRTLTLSLNHNKKLVQQLSQETVLPKPSLASASTKSNTSYIVLLFLCSMIFFGMGWYFLPLKILGYLSIFFGIVMLLGSMFFAFTNISEKSEVEERNRQALEKYERDLAAHQQQMVMNKQRAASLQADCRILERQLGETQSLLNRYYDMDVIYGKYRGIVPVAMFVQYIESGRASQLTGHEGCYNLFESEQQRGLILAKLDQVIEQLDTIRESQYELTNAIRSSNQKINQLCDINHETNQHLAIQSYSQEQTNRNVNFLKDYTIFRDLMR